MCVGWGREANYFLKYVPANRRTEGIPPLRLRGGGGDRGCLRARKAKPRESHKQGRQIISTKRWEGVDDNMDVSIIQSADLLYGLRAARTSSLVRSVENKDRRENLQQRSGSGKKSNFSFLFKLVFSFIIQVVQLDCDSGEDRATYVQTIRNEQRPPVQRMLAHESRLRCAWPGMRTEREHTQERPRRERQKEKVTGGCAPNLVQVDHNALLHRLVPQHFSRRGQLSSPPDVNLRHPSHGIPRLGQPSTDMKRVLYTKLSKRLAWVETAGGTTAMCLGILRKTQDGLSPPPAPPPDVPPTNGPTNGNGRVSLAPWRRDLRLLRPSRHSTIATASVLHVNRT